MLNRVFSSVGLLLMLAAIVTAQQLPSAKNGKLLTVKVVESGGIKPRLLMDLSVQIAADGGFDFRSGGQEKASTDESIEFGTILKGTVTTMENGQCKLSARIDMSTPVGTDEPSTQIIRSDAMDIRTILIAGQAKRLQCGGNRTIELTLTAD